MCIRDRYYLGEQATEHEKKSCILQTLILLFNTTIKCGESHCMYQKCYSVLKKLRPKTLMWDPPVSQKQYKETRALQNSDPLRIKIKWYFRNYFKKTTALDPRQRPKISTIYLLGHSPHAYSCWPHLENEILRKSLRYFFLSCVELASSSHFVRIQCFSPVRTSVGTSVAFWQYFLFLSPTNFSLISRFLPLCSEVNCR